MSHRKTPTCFTVLAKGTSRYAGKPATFALVLLLVLAWGLSGPYFDYSDSWQLTINTFTTIVTFLMVFLIQATQNRDAEAMQIKLDELIRSTGGAHNALLDLEELEEDELMQMRSSYLEIAERARRRLKSGKDDTGVPDVGDAKTIVSNVRGGQRKPR